MSYLEGLANYVGSGAKVYYDRGLPTLDDIAKQTEFTTEAMGEVRSKTEFFTNRNLQGAAAVTRTDKHVNYEPARGGDGAASDISIRWSGYFTPSVPGDYLVFVQGPEKTAVTGSISTRNSCSITGRDWYAFVGQTSMTLTSGPHEVELDYYAKGGWGKTVANLGIVRPETLVTADAKSLASHADAVVLAVGFDTSNEGESGDRTFRLPPGQDELIKQITAANKNTIVVVTSGGGVDMAGWVDRVPALLQAWYPGQEGGTAVAQLLFGEFNPSGRLPISIERRWEDNATHDSYYPKNNEKKVEYTEGIFVGYRHFDKSGIKPLFPFGYGLSYTTFAYKNLNVSPASGAVSGSAQDDRRVTVSFEVTNTGSRAGADVAQVYVGDQHASVPRPVKELKGFAKVSLNPGETRHVEVTLDRRAFSYYDVKSHKWTVAPAISISTSHVRRKTLN